MHKNLPRILTTIHNNSQQFTTIHNNSQQFTTIHNNSQQFTTIYKKKNKKIKHGLAYFRIKKAKKV